jgi:hypothetical protein
VAVPLATMPPPFAVTAAAVAFDSVSALFISIAPSLLQTSLSLAGQEYPSRRWL